MNASCAHAFSVEEDGAVFKDSGFSGAFENYLLSAEDTFEQNIV